MKLDRRSFLLGTAGLAGLPWVASTPARAQSSANSALWYLADAEVDSFDYYLAPTDPALGKLRAGGNSPVISTEQSRAGRKSFRMYLNRKTSTASAYRTEAWVYGRTNWGQGECLQWRKTYWIGFSIYIPRDWQAGTTTEEVLFQIHNYPDDWANAYTPPVCIRIQPNDPGWYLRVLYKTSPEYSGGQVDVKSAVGKSVGPRKVGGWTDWVIEYRPDWRPLADGGVGVTRFWMDGNKVLDYAGPNTYNDTNGPYPCFGLYKSGWRDVNFSDPVTERLYYHDEWRVSRPDQGNYELVAPGAQQGLAIPMAPEGLKVS